MCRLHVGKPISKHESLWISKCSSPIIDGTINLDLTFAEQCHWANFRSRKSWASISAIWATSTYRSCCRSAPRSRVSTPFCEFLSAQRLSLTFRVLICIFAVASWIPIECPLRRFLFEPRSSLRPNSQPIKILHGLISLRCYNIQLWIRTSSTLVPHQSRLWLFSLQLLFLSGRWTANGILILFLSHTAIRWYF